MKTLVPAVLVALCLMLQSSLVQAARDPAMPPVGMRPITLYADYQEAYEAARIQEKMLLIFFYEHDDDPAVAAFENRTLADPLIRDQLVRYVYVKLPLDAEIQVDGQLMRVLDHDAFAEMRGRQGIAIVDLENYDAEHYGRVVSTFPFKNGRYYTPDALSVILDLPAGTLTQRTMIYAVRTHPERPASAWGTFHPVLAEAAASHSQHQAEIGVQGHHNWDSRFHQINARLPAASGAQEVVAESWGGQPLVDACIECVNSWRQSSGHWSAVRSRQRLFGYDIKRGSNGVWYATGIFARGH